MVASMRALENGIRSEWRDVVFPSCSYHPRHIKHKKTTATTVCLLFLWICIGIKVQLVDILLILNKLLSTSVYRIFIRLICIYTHAYVCIYMSQTYICICCIVVIENIHCQANVSEALHQYQYQHHINIKSTYSSHRT